MPERAIDSLLPSERGKEDLDLATPYVDLEPPD